LVLGKPLLDFLTRASIARSPGGGVTGQARTINGRTFELKLYNSGYLSNGSNNIEAAETNAMRALRRQVPLYVALKRTVEMLEPIIEEVKGVNAPRRRQNIALIAIDAIAWGLIKLRANTLDKWQINTVMASEVAVNDFGPVSPIVALSVAFLAGDEYGLPYNVDRKTVQEYSLIPLCRAFVRYIEKQGHLSDSTLEAFKREILSANQTAQRDYLGGNSSFYEEALRNLKIFKDEATSFVSRFSDSSIRAKRDALTAWNVGADESDSFIDYTLEIYRKLESDYNTYKEQTNDEELPINMINYKNSQNNN
jgi:hypothetical protein